MDEVNDFFDFSKPFVKKVVQGSYVAGKILTTPSMKPEQIVKREQFGAEYVDEYVKEEQVKLNQMMEEYETGSTVSSFIHRDRSRMDTVDISSSDSDDDMEGASAPREKKMDVDFYKQFDFRYRSDVELPIHENELVILNTIEKSPVCILTGDTGCGKTTQVPQFILDRAQSRGEYCNIICTQPRRIAAISIAQRVCAERKWELGELVGYQVGLHTLSNEDTRLLYCTTGVLLQKLVKTKNMSKYTHIILDEVHERDQEMDFLLIVIRRLLISNSPHTKVVLMSATINPREFSEYFSSYKSPAPVLKVDNRRRFQVRDFYLCQLERLVTNYEYNFNMSEPKIDEELYKIAVKLLYVCESLDLKENSIEINGFRSTVLVFLPGVNEIDNMEKYIESHKGDFKINTIRLHSLVSPEEQHRVFMKANKMSRKVILATNIAESSITVPDVKYVIDFCLTKNLMTDSNSNFSSLQLQWASKSNCLQRSGRAGRVMNGRVYRLVPREFYQRLPDYGIPEMLRIPLENVVLKAKQLEMGPPHTILGLALTPPNLSDIHNTVLILKELGGLYRTVNGKYMEFDGDLSFIGRVMSALPLDIRISRLVIFGYMFSVFDECLIIAAGLNVKSIFTSPYTEAFPAWVQRLTWADGSASDLFAILKAYNVWKTRKEQGLLRKSEEEHTWARRYYLNARSLREMSYLIEEIKKRLVHLNFQEFDGTEQTLLLEREKAILLKICIAGAFYPNYFVRSSYGSGTLQRDYFHALCGNNPCNTVFFNKFDQKYIGELYTKKIKRLFEVARIPPQNIQVKFQEGNEKVFVTFKDDPSDQDKSTNKAVVPGKVKLEVYKAVKMRQSKCPTSIQVMDPRNGLSFAVRVGLGELKYGRFEKKKMDIKRKELIVIPSVFSKCVRGNITHIENCSKFFFMPLSEKEMMSSISSRLNDFELEKFENPDEIIKNMMVAVKYGGEFRRAKILTIITENPIKGISFKVLFIDNGNVENAKFSSIRNITHIDLLDIPPRVFECTLFGVRPSLVRSSHDVWTREAIEMLSDLQVLDFIEVEIYSVVEGVASVIIQMNDRLTINDELVNEGYGQSTDESYLSKVDHDLRIRRQANSFRKREDEIMQNEEYLQNLLQGLDEEITIPEDAKCMIRLQLNGPHSPLETRIYSAMRIGSFKSVGIEQNSVNSVMLDSDPQDNHERLLVAVSVTEQFESQKLTARSVSLMPNIHGFGALMALIFAPQIQIKRNTNKTKYTAVLCGLGFDEITGKSLYEEHDILMYLDMELTPKDIELVNQIRYSFDTMLFTSADEEKPRFLKNTKSNLCDRLKNLVIKLLEKPRKFTEITRSINDNEWDPHLYQNKKDVLETDNVYQDRSIFPVHRINALYCESKMEAHELTLHCEALHTCRKNDYLDTTIKCCKLCDEPLESIVELRIHLLSQLHRDREYQIKFHQHKMNSTFW
ncbi:TDRD9 family protein [Megaselia abdita]